MLAQVAFWKRRNAERGLLRAHLHKRSGARASACRAADRTYLAGRQMADGGKGAQPFRTRYTHEDILLLAETDE